MPDFENFASREYINIVEKFATSKQFIPEQTLDEIRC
jgi:hypothetical protein